MDLNKTQMKSVEAHFEGNNRTYTYAVDPELPVEVGQRYLTNTPRKGFTYVNILKVHKVSQLDPHAKFEYKELKSLITTEKRGEFYIARVTHCDKEFGGSGASPEEAISLLLHELNR